MDMIYIPFLIAMSASGILTFLLIPYLKRRQFGQYIREEGPKSHLKKQGTPTMGGIAIVIALVFASLIVGKVGTEIVVMSMVTILFSLIGFLDDFIKIALKHNLGLRAWQKLLLQGIFSVLFAVYVSDVAGYGSGVFIPFLHKEVDFGVLYIPFVAFVMVAMTNSVNLTDGLDGLCSGVTALVSACFAFSGMFMQSEQSVVFISAVGGACIGFLIFNRNPAKIFMGDTGSMGLGAAVASASVMMKLEFLLIIAGVVYVLEALSVIIQVLYYKKTGRRVFKMAPIHHHFELSGMTEIQVVLMFYAFTAFVCIMGYFVFRI